MPLIKPPSLRLRRAQAVMHRAERLKREGRTPMATRMALAAVRVLGNKAGGKIRVVSPKTPRYETAMLRLIEQAKTFGVHLCAYTGTFNTKRDVHGRTIISAEHVVPQCLGGAVRSGAFVLQNIDLNANSTLGRHVDRPFVRSWIMQTARFACAMRYADPDNPDSLLMTCYGQSEELSTPDRVCDIWQDPATGFALHMHAPYPLDGEIPIHAGHPITKKTPWDPGEVYWVAMSDRPLWLNPVHKVIQNEFPGARIIFVNIRHSHGLDPVLTTDQTVLRDRIMAMFSTGQGITGKFSVSTFFGDRWLAKTALGFGALLLGDRFIASSDARRLRDFMWAKTAVRREEFELHGSGFITSHNLPFTRVPDCHTFTVLDTGSLVLEVTLYGSLQAVIVIATDRRLWEGRIGDGVSYIVAPTLRESVGPIPFPSLIAHMTLPTFQHPDIADLQTKLASVPHRPPLKVPNP